MPRANVSMMSSFRGWIRQRLADGPGRARFEFEYAAGRTVEVRIPYGNLPQENQHVLLVGDISAGVIDCYEFTPTLLFMRMCGG